MAYQYQQITFNQEQGDVCTFINAPYIKDGEKVIANVHISPTSPSIPSLNMKMFAMFYDETAFGGQLELASFQIRAQLSSEEISGFML